MSTANAQSESTAVPLISVTVCTCNGVKFIAEQIESLLVQDDPHFEIIVSDDASTDGTWEYLHTQVSSRLRAYRNTERLGFNGNFVHAFGLARGSLIAPCDQDDHWQPNKLSRLRRALGNAPLIYCDSRLVDAAGHDTGRRLSDDLCFYHGRDPLAFAFQNCVSGHALLFRRNLLDIALPIPPEALYYDWWLATIAAAHGGVACLMEPLVSYRLHAQMQSGLVVNRTESLITDHRRRAAFLEAIAKRLPAPHRVQALQLAAHLRRRLTKPLSPGFGWFVWKHGAVLFHIKGGVHGRRFKRAFEYAIGIPMKRLFRPGKYRSAQKSPAQ